MGDQVFVPALLTYESAILVFISRGKASAIIPNPFDLPHFTQLHMYYYPSVIFGGLVEDTQVSYIKWSSTFNLPHLLDLKCAHSLPEPSLRIRRGDSV